jgi:serine/threonine-protein kinase
MLAHPPHLGDRPSDLTLPLMDSLLERLQTALGTEYVVERELGGGGMSRVFLAEEKALGRRVVIKVLPPELWAGVSAERFRREIRLAAQLQHPHIVPVLQAGESGDLVYYTMPFVEGDSVGALVSRQGALPIADVRRIACDVLDALVYAHAHGVVHRDIKPDNVLISGSHAVVTDFGVAKALTAAADDGSATASGIALGTPAYMAPEQVAADPNTDHRADIYSFGALLYEMLAGRPPFVGSSPQAVLAAQVTQSAEPITRHRSTVPAELASQVMACLEKHPADRPQSAELLLRNFQGMPSAADAVSVGRVGVPNRARRLAIGAAAITLVVAIGAYAASRVRSPRSVATPNRSIVVLPFVNIGRDSTDEYFSDGMTDELATAIGKIPGVSVVPRSSAYAFNRRRDSLDARQIGQQLKVAYVVDGSIQRNTGRIKLHAQLIEVADNLASWSDSYDRDTKDVFQVQEDIARSIASALQVRLTSASDSLVERHDPAAYELYLKGLYAWNQRTGTSLTQAVRYFEEAVKRDPRFARAYAGVAESYVLMPCYAPSRPTDAWSSAKAAAEHALALDSTLAEAHASLGYGKFLYERDFAAAERELQRAIAMNPRYGTAHQWYADVLGGHGRIDQRLREMKIAQQLDPLSRIISHEVAKTLFIMGRNDEAIALLRQTLDLDPSFAPAQRTLGRLYALKGMRDSGLFHLRKSLELSRRRPIDVAHLAFLHDLAGQRDSARALVDELERRARTEYVPAYALAIAYAGRGDMDRAFAQLTKAIEDKDPTMSENWFNPEFESLHADPRWPALLDAIYACL